jgi:serine/threonine-protein kinase
MEHTRILHYDMGRRLGRGGMGEVYEALDLDLGRTVALKFVAPELAADADALKRFEREARAAAALSHPHIATVYAFERDGTRAFIAMERMAGGTVRDRIQLGPRPIGEALAIARDAAGALALAHRRGIVHRDVKPENLMFDDEGIVKLTDFGLARAVQASRTTMPGTALGTAAYMPPEATGDGTAAPGDVFALGVTLHEMLAAALPFKGDSPLALLYTIANEEPQPLRDARPDAPERVEALILRMLAKTPALRPEAAMVARELAAIIGAAPPFGAGDSDGAAIGRAPPGGLPGIEGAPWATTIPIPRPGRRRARPWLVAAAIAAPVIVGLWLVVPGVLSERQARRRQEATRLTDEGVDSLTAGRLASARRLFESALARDRDYDKASVGLGRTLHALGDDARAALVLRGVLSRHAADRELSSLARDALADMDMEHGNWEGAVESLRRAFALDSTSARAYNQLGYALVRAGQPVEASALLLRAIERFPAEAALHKNLGMAELAMGDARGAENEAGIALSIDGSYAAALALRARARARTGNGEGARTDWALYLAAGPDPADSAETAAELRRRGLMR